MIFPVGITIVLTIFVLFSIGVFYFGKNRGTALALSFYPAYLLFDKFPYLDKLIFTTNPQYLALNKTLIFFGFLFITYIIISGYIAEDFGNNRFVSTFLLGLVLTVLTLGFAHFILPVDQIYSFSPKLNLIFNNTIGFFWWITVPLILLFFV